MCRPRPRSGLTLHHPLAFRTCAVILLAAWIASAPHVHGDWHSLASPVRGDWHPHDSRARGNWHPYASRVPVSLGRNTGTGSVDGTAVPVSGGTQQQATS